MVADGYKDTEIGVIPVGWEVKYVKDIAKIITGKKDTQDKIEGGKYPFFVRSQTIERINSYSFDGEAVLTAGDGVGVGKIYHYLNEKFDYHQRVYNIHNFANNVSGKYFYEYFKAKFYSRVSRMSAKNSVDSVRLDMIAKMEIPLPPLKEQEKIADILSTADEKIDAIASQIQKAQTLKKGLLQKLLSEGIGHSEFKDSELGKIPASWEVVELEKGCRKIIGGGTPSKNNSSYWNNGTILWATPTEFTKSNDRYISTTTLKITQKGLENSSATLLNQGTVIMSSRATIGECKINTIEMTTNQGFISYECNEILNNLFLLYLIGHYKDRIIKVSSGSTFLEVSRTTMRNFKIPLPPLEEQKQIAEILSTADEKLEVLGAKKEKYETLKKGLLQKLLSGEVRV